jgi:hypothetical protein
VPTFRRGYRRQSGPGSRTARNAYQSMLNNPHLRRTMRRNAAPGPDRQRLLRADAMRAGIIAKSGAAPPHKGKYR